ncbi:MAG: D-glycerate dehydrogenase [Anaerolineaceae bacterium]|nr:D-glycerate dehydrogenase [Anaerolineaceae bacterium]
MDRVFVTRQMPPTGLEMLREACEVVVWEDDLPPPQDVLMQEAAQSDGLLSLLTDKVDAALMEQAPRLRVISNYAVGYDNIDIPAATERGIPVGHTPGVLTESCADHAFALLLAAARRISEAERYVRAGKWQTWHPTLLLGQDVHNATLGIAGFGRIGQAVARRATGFGMRIIYTGGSSAGDVATELGAEQVDMETLLRESDFISLHTPLNADTTHLINAEALQMMKKTAILINTARGKVVDSTALYAALKAGDIAYAALDVTDPEPITMDDPLLTLDNCLIVPHIASASYATRDRIGQIAAANLLAGLKGEPMLHCVNPQVQGK